MRRFVNYCGALACAVLAGFALAGCGQSGRNAAGGEGGGDALQYVMVTSADANLWAEPDTKSATLCVDFIDAGDGWWGVRWSNEPVEEDADRSGYAGRGDVYQLLASDGDWMKVRVPGDWAFYYTAEPWGDEEDMYRECWIRSADVQIVEPTKDSTLKILGDDGHYVKTDERDVYITALWDDIGGGFNLKVYKDRKCYSVGNFEHFDFDDLTDQMLTDACNELATPDTYKSYYIFFDNPYNDFNRYTSVYVCEQ